MGRKGKDLSIEVRNLIKETHKNNRNVSSLSRISGIFRSAIRSIVKKLNQGKDVKINREEAGSFCS